MITDLLHNKIIKDTVTEGFISAFVDNLVPKLSERYGDGIEAVQMYEDHLADSFKFEGEFYYPLTVRVNGKTDRVWIKWDVSEPRNFGDGIPYSYIGEEPLELTFADSVPEEFVSAILDRASYFEGGAVVFKLQSVSDDKTFLSGKYSQTFVDELTRSISKKIEDAFAVTGIEDSGVELLMVFAPGTYMEHIVENVTYRRLLITARGCSARDLWVKWTNKKGNTPYTVSDHVRGDEIEFDLGEDVPQKIREKEYRFLVRSSADKYQAAMGRKNITEWRDLIKRVIKRGELVKRAIVEPDPEAEGALAFKLHELLGGAPEIEETPVEAAPAVAEAEVEKDNSDLTAMLSSILGREATSESELAPSEYIPEAEKTDVTEALEAILEEDKEPEPVLSESEDVFTSEDEADIEEYKLEEEAEAAPASGTDIEDLRRQIEAEIREKLALEAKAKAEAEAEELRRAHEELRLENERLAEAARIAEEERRQEAERYRLEIEAREHREAREKERIAQAARLALIEQQRLAEEREAEARRKKEAEEARLLEEARLKEEARIAAERKAEEARIQAEMAAKAKAEAEANSAATAEAKTAEQKRVPEYDSSRKYVSKNAKLLFRAPIDPNITKRIHEIIVTTIKYFHKEHVYMKIKATVPDATTVNLRFVEIPEEETELLVQIIKVLGKSNLGITKVFLE